jgi:hypothetical protein
MMWLPWLKTKMAHNALPTSSLSAVSTFKRQRATTTAEATITSNPPSASEHSQRVPCSECKKMYSPYTEGRFGWNIRPHQYCIECHHARHRRNSRQTAWNAKHGNVQAVTQDDSFSDEPISKIAAQHRQLHYQEHTKAPQPLSLVCIDHLIFTKGEWKRAQLRKHSRVKIMVSIDKSSPRRSASTAASKPLEIKAMANTGAQSDLMSLRKFLSLGFSRDDLFPVSLSLAAANKSPIAIEGVFLSKLTGRAPNGEVFVSKSMVYV